MVKSDGDGRFIFKGLPGGRYTVQTFVFRKPGERLAKEAKEEIDLPSGEIVELILERRDA